MIKTKCIFELPKKEDGTRICVMRYKKPFYKYDEWLVDLSPSEFLLNLYRTNDIDWKMFSFMYDKEMREKNKVSLIKSLRERSDGGEIITLLCWEKEDSKCHRRLLKELIEQQEKVKKIDVRITYYGEKGTIYSEIDSYQEDEVDIGEWKFPFDVNSPAIGQIECLMQSDDCPPRFQFETICKVIVEEIST